MKYSPDESHLAVGSHDNHVYIYEIKEDGYHLVATDKRNSAWITAIDWSVDGQSLRTASGDYEELYYDVVGKAPLMHASQKDWASSTAIVSDRKTLKPASEDKTHVNDVCGSGNLKFTGDDFSLVNVYSMSNPSVQHSRSYGGHSEHVTKT